MNPATPHVTIVSATLDEIVHRIDQKADERAKMLANIEKKQDAMMGFTVDRAFLERNLNLTRRKIEKYEREGVLRRVYNPNDAKGCYYRLKDCINLL